MAQFIIRRSPFRNDLNVDWSATVPVAGSRGALNASEDACAPVVACAPVRGSRFRFAQRCGSCFNLGLLLILFLLHVIDGFVKPLKLFLQMLQIII